MIIIDEKKIKNSDSKDTYIRMIIQPDSLSKFPMQIMYYKERGFNNFILTYLNENCKYSFDKLAGRILPNVFETIEKQDVRIGISGFPICIFEQYFLKDELKFKFEDKLFFHEECEENCDNFEKALDCIDCKLTDKCVGMYKKHLKKYKEDLNPIYVPSDLQIYYDKMLNYLHDDIIKSKFNFCLNDYMSDEGVNNKRLYQKERISSGSDETKESFSYSIINSKKTMDENIGFVARAFDKNIEPINEYLQKSGFFILHFELISDGSIKNRLEIDSSNLNDEEINRLFDLCKFTPSHDLDTIDSIKIEVNDNSFEIIELGYKIELIQTDEVKKLFKEYGLEQKRMLLKYLNSMHKDVKNAKLKYKYEHSIPVSTSFETTLKENTLKLRLLSVLFGIKLNHLFERKILNMWFEIYEFQSPKYGFNHMPKLPKRMPEFEERVYD